VLIVGDDTVGHVLRFRISARRGVSGVVLRLREEFKEGDYARFKSHFHKDDVVIGLDLSSNGGDFEEGVQIANLARQKKLSIYVAEECDSVCAIVFFAAAKRYLARDSRVGVHSISNSRDIEDFPRVLDLGATARRQRQFIAPAPC
jgi:hypothetical protein